MYDGWYGVVYIFIGVGKNGLVGFENMLFYFIYFFCVSWYISFNILFLLVFYFLLVILFEL